MFTILPLKIFTGFFCLYCCFKLPKYHTIVSSEKIQTTLKHKEENMNITPNTQVHVYFQIAFSAFTHTHTHIQNLLSKCNLVSKVKCQTVNLE